MDSLAYAKVSTTAEISGVEGWHAHELRGYADIVEPRVFTQVTMAGAIRRPWEGDDRARMRPA